jgi:hypothetical protein
MSYADLVPLLIRGKAPPYMINNAHAGLYDPLNPVAYPDAIMQLIIDCQDADCTVMGCNMYGVIDQARAGYFGIEPDCPECPECPDCPECPEIPALVFPVLTSLLDTPAGGIVTSPFDTRNFDTQGTKLTGVLWNVGECVEGAWTPQLWDATTAGGTYAAVPNANYQWKNQAGVVIPAPTISAGSGDDTVYTATVTTTTRRFVRLRVASTGSDYELYSSATSMLFL